MSLYLFSTGPPACTLFLLRTSCTSYSLSTLSRTRLPLLLVPSLRLYTLPLYFLCIHPFPTLWYGVGSGTRGPQPRGSSAVALAFLLFCTLPLATVTMSYGGISKEAFTDQVCIVTVRSSCSPSPVALD